MFTGLVDEIGSIESVSRTDAGIELRIHCAYRGVDVGESISVNGACLTVLAALDEGFAVAAMVTTASRTTVGDWRAGQRINLERAMRADARFGGHIVQGHVDGVGTVASMVRREDAILLDIALPTGLSETLVLHGSVTVDGVSLTVNAIEGDMLQVALIEYTLKHTALQGLKPGDRVNIETDVIGKYVQRLVAPYLNSTKPAEGES
ncbi:MAG: riboflavin synthase [Gemmatimonadaceae bacterium]